MLYLLQLTGPNKEKFRKLRIKVNAVHAGPSQLLELWNQLAPFSNNNYLTYLNNNWLIAQLPMEMRDAMED